MTYSKENLTDEDMDFIASSLNQTFHHAVNQLESRTLGDLERKWLMQTKLKAKELMNKIET